MFCQVFFCILFHLKFTFMYSVLTMFLMLSVTDMHVEVTSSGSVEVIQSSSTAPFTVFRPNQKGCCKMNFILQQPLFINTKTARFLSDFYATTQRSDVRYCNICAVKHKHFCICRTVCRYADRTYRRILSEDVIVDSGYDSLFKQS